MGLEKLVNSNKDVLIKDIPKEWQDSYRKFLFGQSYYKNGDGDDITFYSDFYRWYNQNREALDREINIDKIIGNG